MTITQVQAAAGRPQRRHRGAAEGDHRQVDRVPEELDQRRRAASSTGWLNGGRRRRRGAAAADGGGHRLRLQPRRVQVASWPRSGSSSARRTSRSASGRFGHDEYTHYYFAQAMYVLGDDGWEKLFPGEKERR